MHHTITVHASIPVIWLGTGHPTVPEVFTPAKAMKLTPEQPANRDETITLPAGTPLTQPYWLREEPGTGMFHVADASLIGRPENPPAFPVEQVFGIGGLTLVVPGEPAKELSMPVVRPVTS